MNHSESITTFMRWAHDRIAKEFAENEAYRQKTGEFFEVKKLRSRREIISDNEKLKVIAEVDKLRDAGESSKAACIIVNIHPTTYSLWRKNANMSKYKKQK